ncbi:MAG: Uma2 family endonuclease [Pyrinomonadaceae bacterium]
MSVQKAKAVHINRRSFTVAEYERMGQSGIFSEDDRVELVCGEIIAMPPIGERHAASVGCLTQLITLRLRRSAIVWVQNPVQLDDHTQPQPDIAVLKPRDDFYRHRRPGPEDILLIIEVSDTTLEYDMKVKVPLYARAGIPETWLVNLRGGRIKTYADPAKGAYQTIASYARGEELQSRTVAALRVGVAEVIG